MKAFAIASIIVVSLVGASALAFFTYALWTLVPWHPLTVAFTAGCAFVAFWNLRDAFKSINDIKTWKP